MKETHLHISISILPLIGKFNTDMMYLTLYNYFIFLFLFFRVSLYSELVDYELYLKKKLHLEKTYEFSNLWYRRESSPV